MQYRYMMSSFTLGIRAPAAIPRAIDVKNRISIARELYKTIKHRTIQDQVQIAFYDYTNAIHFKICMNSSSYSP